VSETGAERGRLVFGHARLALAALGALAVGIALLAWLDDARSKRELERWRERLCAELPAELVKGLGALSRDALRAPDAARQALAVLQGLAGDTSEAQHTQGRILFETARGWRELRRWSDELDWTHDPALLAAVRSWRCDATLEHGTLRAVRPVQTGSGVVVLLVLERSRH
jgi:hypothetical protein